MTENNIIHIQLVGGSGEEIKELKEDIDGAEFFEGYNIIYTDDEVGIAELPETEGLVEDISDRVVEKIKKDLARTSLLQGGEKIGKKKR